MAQLNSEAIIMAAAVQSMTLTTGIRLARNFKYYRIKPEDRYVQRSRELTAICDQLNHDIYGFHNLLAESDINHKLFLVALANQISDLLEELHRKLICFNASDIDDLIPELDSLRTFWSDYTDVHFYSAQLNHHLEKNIPRSMKKIKSGIQSLPDSVEL
jgi:hypothetical protein